MLKCYNVLWQEKTNEKYCILSICKQSTTINNKDKDEMDKAEVEIQDTKLPFSNKYVALCLTVKT